MIKNRLFRALCMMCAASLVVGGISVFAEDASVWCETFEDNTYSQNFDKAGNPALEIVNNPVTGAGGKVLKFSTASQTAAYIRNKAQIIPGGATGTYEVGVDCYIPDTSFTADTNILQFMINNEPAHRVELCSSAKDDSALGAFQMKFPYNAWFRVVFKFNFDTKKYDVYLKKDGRVYATKFTDRGLNAGDPATNGITTLRIHLSGSNQVVYFDNFGVKTETESVSFGLYDFESNSWADDFDHAGSATWSIGADPENAARNVLVYTHTGTQSKSYIRNKITLGDYKYGKWEVGADLYIPSGALTSEESFVRLMLNGDSAHRLELIPEDVTASNAFRTTEFPRDKWIRVRFAMDIDAGHYNAEILADGKVITRHFSNRGMSSIKQNGLKTLQLYIDGSEQTIYVENMGICEYEEEIEKVPGVNFIRIDGLNMAGETQSIYGDFVNGASVDQLENIRWSTSDTIDGEYTDIEGAGGTQYIPENGGYYLKVSAAFGTKKYESYPVYIREAGKKLDVKAYLGYGETGFKASLAYINEGEARSADMILGTYDESGRLLGTYMDSAELKQGNDIVVKEFGVTDPDGMSAKLFVVDKSNMEPLCVAAAADGQLPEVSVESRSTGTTVYLGEEPVADFRQNRYMRFRSGTDNDHWLGTVHNPSDMGAAYQEPGVKGFDCTNVEWITAPGVYKVSFDGVKASTGAKQHIELAGFWNKELNGFELIRNSSITVDTKAWHANSSWAPSGEIEMFDYCIERMSILDRVYNNNLNGDLYDYIIYSDNGEDAVRIPKIPVPRTMLPGDYYCVFRLSPGGVYTLADPKEGGWDVTLLDDSGDTRIEICWSWYDLHNCVNCTVPQVGAQDEFTATQSWLYTPTVAGHDSELIERATEIDYKDLPNYQLPTFGKENTFDKQVGDIDWCYAWWKSNYDCTMDSSVGHSDNASVKIENTAAKSSSWYTEGVWGFPYSFDNVKGRVYELSGWIKTEDVEGEAYIANKQYLHATPNKYTLTKSQTLSGTNDWTYVSLEFIGQQRPDENGDLEACIDHFFLTLNGSGKVWFDDVVIKESDKVLPKTVIKPKLTFESGSLTNSADTCFRMWFVSPPATENATIKNSVVDSDGGKMMKTTVNGSGTESVNGRYISLEGKCVISFDLTVEQGAMASAVIRPGANEGTVELLSVSDTGELTAGGNVIADDVYGKKLSVTVVADTDACNYDIYVNGEAAARDVQLSQSADYSLSSNELRFIIKNITGGAVSEYVDNVICYSINVTTAQNAELENGVITVSFDNPIDPESVAGGVYLNGEAVDDAVLSDDLTKLYITPQTQAQSYTLTLDGIADICANNVQNASFEVK